jgi:hypothetical protein
MPERPLPVGKGFIFATREDFLNGYQAGHLTYMAARTKHPQLYTDEEMRELFFEKLEDMSLTTTYGIGFVVGWLHTLASNGTTNHAGSVATPPPAPLEGYTIEEEGK